MEHCLEGDHRERLHSGGDTFFLIYIFLFIYLPGCVES